MERQHEFSIRVTAVFQDLKMDASPLLFDDNDGADEPNEHEQHYDWNSDG